MVNHDVVAKWRIKNYKRWTFSFTATFYKLWGNPTTIKQNWKAKESNCQFWMLLNFALRVGVRMHAFIQYPISPFSLKQLFSKHLFFFSFSAWINTGEIEKILFKLILHHNTLCLKEKSTRQSINVKPQSME